MVIIDYSQIAISNILHELRGQQVNFADSMPLLRHMILNAIRSIRHKFFQEYGEVVIACDGRNYWRKTEFPYYKAGRKDSRDKTVDWDALFSALHTIKEELKEYFPYPVIEVEGAEADDIIAVVAEWVSANDLEDGIFSDGKPVVIVSGDNDFIQLQYMPNVKQYSPKDKKFLKPDTTIAEFLFDHIIEGDKGDGIPNVLSDDDVFVDSTKRQTPLTKKRRAELKEMFVDKTQPPSDTLKKNFERNTKLIDLSRIPDNIRDSITAQFVYQKNTKSRDKILSYFQMHGMKQLIGYITQF
jgi:hypothetical protein